MISVHVGQLFTWMILVLANRLCATNTSLIDEYYIQPDLGISSSSYTLNHVVGLMGNQSTTPSSLTLHFYPGNHYLNSNFSLFYIDNITFQQIESSEDVLIHCKGDVAFRFFSISLLQITGLSFVSCGSQTDHNYYLPGIWIQYTVAFLSNISIINSSAPAFETFQSTITFNSVTYSNNAPRAPYNVFTALWSTVIFYGESVFKKNSQTACFLSFSNMTIMGKLTFYSNNVVNRFFVLLIGSQMLILSSGQIHFNNNFANLLFVAVSNSFVIARQGSIHMANNEGANHSPTKVAFNSSNLCLIDGGSFNYFGNSGTVFMINSIISVHQGTLNFTNNHESFNDASTILVVITCSFYLNGEMTFFNNSGTNTGLIFVLSSANMYGNVSIVNNEADLMVGLGINNSTLYMEGALVIRNNTLSKSSVLSVSSSHVYLNCTVDIFQNTAHKVDGLFPFIIAVTFSDIYFFQRFEAFGNSGPYSCFGLINSNFTSYGKWFWKSNNCLDSSYYSFSSTCILFGNVTFSNNFAKTVSGGAITLVSSTMKLQGNSTFIKNRSPTADGGAISIIRSKLIFSGNITFKENTALRGGAINLYHQSILILQPDLVSLVFEKNQAQKGGAIHVDDLISYINCTNQRTIQKFYSERPMCFFEAHGIQNKIKFKDNLAFLRGSALFGGMLDRCVLVLNVVNNNSTPLEVFLDISDIELNNSIIPKISSESFRLCLCQNGQPNCSIRESSLRARRGETFVVSVTAFDQLNASVEAVIRSYLQSDYIDRHQRQRLGDGGSQQTINNMCTNVSYRVWSSSQSETVILYVEGPCKDEGNGSHSIQINFTDCPLGFDLKFDICSCDQRLVQYTNTCDIDSETIERSTNFWIGASYTDNGSYSGLILYPNCPFTYCKWPSRGVDLTSPETQCNYNRSGILCGRCKGNASLLLGTSKCSKCSDYYLFLLIPFSVAGILLVVCLFLLRLTVAEGFLHGLIFYVNIVTSNHSLFVPNGTFKGFSIFLAWLNLDLGIETCFYDGMDQLSMVWLQFVFPFYLLAIVFLIIIVSHYSIRISRLLGKNPVAVLATVIFLSYTKIVRNILVIYSYATVEYPNQLLIRVWLFDGNVNYLQGQHIGLFAFAVLITTFLLLPFTLLLISAQLMMKSQRISSLPAFLKVKPFIDAYHAPYKPSQRYWTGLFLFLRCIILLTFALNALGDSSINLLVITTVCLGVCTLSWIVGGVYTNAHLEVIEAILILNLGVFAAATYHVQLTGGNQAAVANVSITVALLVFLWIVISRIANRFELKSKLSNFLKRAEDETDNLQMATDIIERPERAISFQTIPAPTERHVNIFENNELRESLLA